MKRPTLRQLGSRIFDLAVVGGGATGASIAWEAGRRGLSVALLEKDDFASGTSSRSTKLFHGGLRYLERAAFGFVRESCRERERLLKIAPHLCHPRPFIYLIYKGDRMLEGKLPAFPLLLKAGLSLYDFMAAVPAERRHRMLSRRQLLALEPRLNPVGLKGGGLYYDLQTDDARFVIDLVKSAAEEGAMVANHMQVKEFITSAEKITGVQVQDKLTGEEGAVSASVVVNAGGPWADEIGALAGARKDPPRLRRTKGVHIVLRKQDFPIHHALFFRSPSDGRVVWPIPALDENFIYIGTTDTDFTGSLESVTADAADVDYLLAAANFALHEGSLTRRDVVASWAGLRPLITPDKTLNPSATSREHRIYFSQQGLLHVLGGKLTTACLMAQQAVDKAIEGLAPLAGKKAQGPAILSMAEPSRLQAAKRLLQKQAVPGEGRLLSQYGGDLMKIAQLMETSSDMRETLGPTSVTKAEVVFAVEEEMARNVTDVLARRINLFCWQADGGLNIAHEVANLLAPRLQWNEREKQRQVCAYGEWVRANRSWKI